MYHKTLTSVPSTATIQSSRADRVDPIIGFIPPELILSIGCLTPPRGMRGVPLICATHLKIYWQKFKIRWETSVKLQMGLYPRGILIFYNQIGNEIYDIFNIGPHSKHCLGNSWLYRFDAFCAVCYRSNATNVSSDDNNFCGIDFSTAWGACVGCMVIWLEINILFISCKHPYALCLNPKQRINAELVVCMDTSELRSVGYFHRPKIR